MIFCLLAFPPCRPFAIIGDQKGFSDQRGRLIHDIVRILRVKRPIAFVLENVRQLSTIQRERTLELIIKELSASGYACDFSILNALDFGLPQKRERTVIVGFLDDSLDLFQWLSQRTPTNHFLTYWSPRQTAAEINFQRLDLHSIKRVLANPLYRNSYLMLSGVFLVFSGILNLLPFRLTQIDPTIGPLGISLLYTGYLAGIPIAIMSEKLVYTLDSIRRALLIDLSVNAICLLAYTLAIHAETDDTDQVAALVNQLFTLLEKAERT